jgi:hypothetical protein
MNDEEIWGWSMLLAVALAAWLLAVGIFPSHGRPLEKWAQATPERQQFFQRAMRPDLRSADGTMASPCCGEADAYEADEFDTEDGKLYAVLTCNDPANCAPVEDKTLLPVGTRILIPPEKILPPHQPDNRTGHGWVFLASNSVWVFCYAFPGGS